MVSENEQPTIAKVILNLFQNLNPFKTKAIIIFRKLNTRRCSNGTDFIKKGP